MRSAMRRLKRSVSSRLPRAALPKRPVEIIVAATGMTALLVTLIWSYWPTLVDMISRWVNEPDYSHGFLVVPCAGYFLWARRGDCPAFSRRYAWVGLPLLGAGLALRIVGARYYLNAFDGWSILLWIAGGVVLAGGLPLLRWAGPSVAFLMFMIPMPFQVENMLRVPLQEVATSVSCAGLQMCGQQALAEGNTIIMGENRVEVAQACSGLRIFLGIVALAFAFLILTRREWWEKALLLLSVVPVAVVANATRIVVTGLLMQFVSTEAAQRFTHDVAGWFMIPFAALLFALVLWVISQMSEEVRIMDVTTVVRRRTT